MNEINNPTLQPISEKIQDARQRFHVPGVAVGVLHEGQAYFAGFGVTSVENPLSVTPDTLFQIGSITKTITATVILRLVELAHLDLDAPVRNYLPSLRLIDKDVASRVTLRHLLTHTGGWAGDYFDDAGWGDDALAQIVERLGNLPQLTPLGEIFSYNNAGFYIAGRVIEVLTGKSYENATKELVLTPLGMTHSFFSPAEVMTHRFVVGHFALSYESPRIARPWHLARAANPVGGLVSTVQDLIQYARFQMGDGTAPDGTRLLSNDALRLMQSPHAPADIGRQVGLAWFIKNIGGATLITHGGATKGQLAYLGFVPARNFALAILTNADRGGELNTEVSNWALENYLGAKQLAPKHLPMSQAQLTLYIGKYSGALATDDVELSLQDDALILQATPKGGFPTPDVPPEPAPPPVRVAFYSPDEFVILDEPMQDVRGEFLRGTEGEINWLRLGGRILRRQVES